MPGLYRRRRDAFLPDLQVLGRPLTLGEKSPATYEDPAMRFPPTAFSLALLVAFAAVCPADDNWPQFRGPNGTGLSDAKGLPVKWSEKENVVWKTKIHDKGW